MHKAFFAHISTGPFYGSVLCLNGELPGPEFFTNLELPVIALDGAANTLMAMGIKPSIVIGDLDSLKSEHRTVLETLHNPDQNYSDFQKGMQYLKDQNLLPTIIVGISGGYLDHILHNVNLFSGTDNVCYATPLVCYSLTGTSKFTLPAHTKISLMGMPNAMVTTNGLKWDLQRSLLQFPGPSSAFNRTAKEAVSIDVHRGNVLAIIYLEEILDAGLG